VKLLIVSKAHVHSAYREKLRELARLGVELTAVVPPEWREADSVQPLEHGPDDAYDLIVSPMRFNGRFHLHYYPELPGLIRSLHPDLLHMDEEPYNLATYLGTGTARRNRTPSLFFSYQNLLRRYPPPFRQMERAVYGCVACALAASDEAADVLRAKGVRKSISVVPQFGVDVGLLNSAPMPHQGFVVGFINRLIPGKAPLLALQAFATLPSDTELMVVGDGPLRTKVEEAVERRGLRERVKLTARRPSSEVPELLRGLDVVLLPSLTSPRWKEQFGRILVEAMACGVPVIGSDSGEIPKVVGDAGIIVPEGDVGALASALRRLYDSQTLRRDLADRGRDRVLSLFTHQRVAERTLAAYEGALV